MLRTEADHPCMGRTGIWTLAATCLALGSAAFVSEPDDGSARDALDQWLRTALAARSSADARVAPAHCQPPGPGRAFDAYGEAAASIRSLGAAAHDRAKQELAVPVDQRSVEVDPAWSAALTALSEGARRSDARYPLDLDAPLDTQVPDLLAWRTLTNVAGAEVRRRIATGDSEGAVALGLDALTMATDVLRAPLLIQQMIGCALVAILTDQTFDEEALSHLDDASRATLTRGLAVLDDATRTWCDGRAEALVIGTQALGSDGSRDSVRAALALATFWDEVAAAPASGWQTRQSQLEAIAARHPDEPIASVPGVVVNCERMIRQAAARIRLLRLAAGDGTVTLEDPLGDGPFLRQETAEGAIVYRCRDESANSVSRRVVPR